jgi:hypothetical protein
MGEESNDAAGSNVMDMFDTHTEVAVVCRVCGALVAAAGDYTRAHWDWHEASNGV